ncbi:MAG: zf-HC2 domain-containing protein [Bryobacteraceae bacterium]
MDHGVAVDTKATIRYLLGEMTEQERDDFEEHYFSCPECAGDVEASRIFIANGRDLCRSSVQKHTAKTRWFLAPGWATPTLAAVCAALVVAVGVQMFSVTPSLRRELAQATAPQFVPEIPLLGVARSPDRVWEVPARTSHVTLVFYFSEPFEKVSYEIRDSVPAIREMHVLPAPSRQPSARLQVPTSRLQPGEYELILRGLSGANSATIGRCRIRVLASTPLS